MWNVGILVFDGVDEDSLSGLLAIFASANAANRPEVPARTLVDVRLLNARSGKAMVAGDTPVVSHMGAESAFDVFWVPAGDVGSVLDDPHVIQELRRARSEAFILAGVGGGCAALAVAGLLRGRVAVEGSAAGLINQLCPDVEVDSTAAFIDQGDLITAPASSTSDLALHLVARIGGTERALEVAAELGIDWKEAAGDEVPPRAGEGLI